MSTWHHTTYPRLFVSLVPGIAAGIAVGWSFGIAAGFVAGWGITALTLAVWALVLVWPMDPDQTQAHATREDPGRRAGRLIATVGSLVSLAAVAIVLIENRGAGSVATYVVAGITVVSVAASWLVIQVTYMLRYAHLYYASPENPIDFNDDDPPQYTDFAYFSAGLGMTYQVADTNVRSKDLRKIVLGQTLLGFLYGTVIIATVINLVASFAG